MRILIFYFELADYVLNCFNQLLKEDEVKILLISYPVNKEAPFQFYFSDRIQQYDRFNSSKSVLQRAIDQFNPDLVLCCGWKDKYYVQQSRKFHKKNIPVILLFDNHWNGNFKQRLSIFFARLLFKKIFNYAWVPGSDQRLFALKLGFKPSNILTGFYTANTELYLSPGNKKLFNKRLICVARYVPWKGYTELWEAFIELVEEGLTSWELWCVGHGEGFNNKKLHPNIKHLGFIQPDNMHAILKQTDVFVLPSHFEPWGVVVHEFALAGFPLVLSDEVGSGTAFLKNGENGYSFKARDKESLKEALRKIMICDIEQLDAMGRNSMDLGMKISPDTWVDTITKIIKNKCVV
jgi:glycosyltransferase involved in cell wall biosynthesis